MDRSSDDAGAARLPQDREKHPPEWERDLNPDHLAGQNVGEPSAEREQGLPTAYDVKDAHRTLRDRFEDDELRQIPILTDGQRLEQGATYVDLHDAEHREFTAMGSMEATTPHRFVPKDGVPYPLWNRLIGVDDPARLDQAARRPREE